MPTAPTITVTDNEDGTATVAVSGSDVGTTNTAYTSPARGGSWTSGGNRSGDGNITVTPTYISNTGGVFHWRVESDDGAVAHSNVLLNRVSKSSQSVKERIVEQVQSDIQGASLSGISSNDVAIQTAPDRIDRRMIIVASIDPERMLEGQRQRTNIRDDIVYPITVAHVDVANRDQTSDKRNRSSQWRQDIRRLFVSDHLTGVDEVRDVTVRYGASVDVRAWFEANLLVGALTLNFTCREVRTL